MRLVIDNFLYLKLDCYLLVADLGKFPLMETTNRYINVLLSESLMVNVAAGLASTGKKIYIYSAAGFSLYRAFDTLKNIINLTTCFGDKVLDITFLNAGSGFIYHNFGITHHLYDDLSLFENNLLNINVYIPYDEATTLDMLNKSYLSKCSTYIRLCPDDMLTNINDMLISNNSVTYTSTIYTMGWLVSYILKLLQRYNIKINVVPITSLISIDKLINYNCNNIAIYDNIKLNIFNSIKHLLFFNNISELIHSNKLYVLKYYGFDEYNIINFIRQYAK